MKSILTLCLLSAGLTAFAPVSVQAQSDSSLRTLATLRGMRFGAAVTFPGSNLALYDSTLSQQYNTVVCENAMKFGSIEPTNNGFNYTAADNIVNFAVAHNMSIRGHNLLWYQQSGYLANLSTASVSRDSFFVLMRRHVNNVVGRYKGKIYEWDVVNEAIDESQSDGNRKTGSANLWALAGNKNDYIDSMFVWAHKADSSARLIYNDYNVEGGAIGGAKVNKANFMYELVKGMKQRGVPINGVGFQSHLTAFDTAAIAANMRRYDSLGLSVSITELDVSISSATDSAQLYSQKALYKSVMAMCLRAPNCKTFMTWGVNDESSWHASNYPLIFKGAAAMTKKPAYYGLQEALLGVPAAVVTVPGAPTSVTATSGAAGTGNVNVTWFAPLSDGNSPLTGYKAMAVSDTSKSCTTTGALTCQISGLTVGTAYTFVVRAGNSAGFGAASLASAAITPPVSLAPGGFLVGVGNFTRAYSFVLPEAAAGLTEELTLTLSNVSGGLVWEKTVRPFTGIREVSWNGETLKGGKAPAGMYIMRVRTRSGGSVQEVIQKGVKIR